MAGPVYRYRTEDLPYCKDCCGREPRTYCECMGKDVYRKGSYQIIRTKEGNITYESFLMLRTVQVHNHKTLRKLWDPLREASEDSTCWICSKPDVAARKFSKYGQRNLLYAILQCSEPLSPYFHHRIRVYDEYRLAHEKLWRESYGIQEDPGGDF